MATALMARDRAVALTGGLVADRVDFLRTASYEVLTATKLDGGVWVAELKGTKMDSKGKNSGGRRVASPERRGRKLTSSEDGFMKGTVRTQGDLIAPVDVEWSVMSGDEDHLYHSSTRRHSPRKK
jgi:hypothetical protein